MQPEKPTEQSPQNIEPIIKPVPVADTTDLFKPDPVAPTPASKRVYNKKLIVVATAIVVLIGSMGGMTFMMTRSKEVPGTSGQKDLITQSSDREAELTSGESVTGAPGQSSDSSTTPPAATSPPSPSSSSPSSSPTPSPSPSSPSSPKTYSIGYTDACYSPASLTIKKGDTVRFVNNSNKNMYPASNGHPIHDIYPEFDAGGNKDEYQFTFTKVGSWGYHDHNIPGCKGTITVQ